MFSNWIPGCSDNFSAFLPGSLSLLPPSAGFLLCSSLSRGFLLIQGLLEFLPDFLSVVLHHSRAFGEGDPWMLNSFFRHLFPPGLYRMVLYPEEANVCSAEVKGSELDMYPPLCPKDLEFHHFLVITAKAALELPILQQPLLVGENKVQHSTSLHWLLYQLGKDSWIAYALLCCPCRRYQGGWSPPWGLGFVNLRLLLSVYRGLQVCGWVVCSRPPVNVPAFILILIHKLLISSSMPRWSSSFTERAIPPSLLLYLSFLKSLHPSISALIPPYLHVRSQSSRSAHGSNSSWLSPVLHAFA